MVSREERCFLWVGWTALAAGVLDVAWDYLHYGDNPKGGPLATLLGAVFEIGMFTIGGIVCGAIAAGVVYWLTLRGEN